VWGAPTHVCSHFNKTKNIVLSTQFDQYNLKVCEGDTLQVQVQVQVQMASLAVPLFLTPTARAIGRARRGATGMAGRAVLAWSALMVWLPLVPRVERARPASDEFLAFCCFGPDKGPSRRQWRLAQRRKGRSRAVQSLIQSVRHTLPKHPYLTHACARATQVPSTFMGAAARESSRERR
jgi:hypothetical protein